MPSWIIAIAAHTDDCVAVHIINAPTWQDALNQSPAVWWHTPQDMELDDAMNLAREAYRCLINVKPL